MDPILITPLAVLLAGFLRGVTGFGFALAAVPLLSLAQQPLFAVIVVQLLQIVVAPVDIVQHHRRIDMKALGLLFAGALIAAPVGAYVATRLDPNVLRIAVALFVLLGLLAILKKVVVPAGARPAVLAGALAGLLAGIAAMPGPPAVAYFLGRNADKAASRASLLVFFSGTALIVLTTMLLTSNAIVWEMLRAAALGFPALLIGNYLGTRLFHRLNDDSYRNLALAMLFISAFLTGLKGLQGLL